MPPTMVTVRTEILEATRRPPITAKPVQMQWPRTPPTITPYTSYKCNNKDQIMNIKYKDVLTLLAARIIVVNWERSPHSARKVIVKA